MHEACKNAVRVVIALCLSDHQKSICTPSLVVRIWICGDSAERCLLYNTDVRY